MAAIAPTRRKEIVDQLKGMVSARWASQRSKHLSETPQAGAIGHWLLTLQLLCGAMRCLRMLWMELPPAGDASAGGDTFTDTPTRPPLDGKDGILPLAASQLCSVHRPLQDRRHVVANAEPTRTTKHHS